MRLLWTWGYGSAKDFKVRTPRARHHRHIYTPQSISWKTALWKSYLSAFHPLFTYPPLPSTPKYKFHVYWYLCTFSVCGHNFFFYATTKKDSVPSQLTVPSDRMPHMVEPSTTSPNSPDRYLFFCIIMGLWNTVHQVRTLRQEGTSEGQQKGGQERGKEKTMPTANWLCVCFWC